MRRRLVAPLACLWALFVASAHAEDTSPARLAPAATVVYAELTNVAPLLDLALASDTRNLVRNSQQYQKYEQSEKFAEVQAVIGLLEGRLGKSWDVALRELVGGGLAVCIDPAANSGFLAVRSLDRDLLARFHGVLLELTESEAKKNGRPSPVKSTDYQGFTGWTFGGDEAHVIIDDLLLLSNKAETLKAAIDRYRDPAASNLTTNAQFAAARARRAAQAIGWSWVDLAAVRRDAKVQEALGKRSDNPLIELLLGGVLDVLKESPYLTSSLAYDAGGVRLRVELPRQGQAVSAAREWFFAPRIDEPALSPPGTIGTFSMFRDLAGLWLARDHLFNEAVVAQLAQANTQLGLFFSGRDFGPEVLGELAAPVQLVVARQEYPSDAPTPALKLPAFSLVFKLKHPDEFSPELLMTYQKTIGIANLVGGQQGNPQLLLSTEEYKGATISKAAYLRDVKIAKEKAPPHYNFSPACARVGDRFIFSSTVGLARQMVDALQPGAGGASLTDNANLTVQTGPLAAILVDNKELLITQNMLKEAHSRSEAETAVQTLLDALRRVDRFVVRLTEEPGALALEAVLGP